MTTEPDRLEALLGCPWCGGEAKFRYDGDPRYPVNIEDHHVEPCPLGFHALQISYPDEATAAAAWNTRIETDARSRRSAEAVMITVPISDVIASVAELGFAGREPEGYPGAQAQCSCCGTMADKWTRIWSVLVGDCCFDKIVTPETPRRVITPYKPQKRWMW